MKNLIYLVPFLFLTTLLQAQFTVEDYDGVPIVDGDLRAFNSLESTGANTNESTLYFWINNLSSEDEILMRIQLISITNADGSTYQFCFGDLCIFDVEEGQIYPVQGGAITIPAGGTNLPENKFQNGNPGDGENYPMDYVWKFYQVDANDNEIGESITFTYRYDPTLGSSDFQLSQMGVTLNNTLAINELRLTVKNPVSYELFSLQGKLVQTNNLNTGNSIIDVSNYKSGLYVMVFKDEDGKKATAKFIKK